MKASYQWLREWLPELKASPKEIAKVFTSIGLEVEAVRAYGEASMNCLVVTVLSSQKHPTHSKLRIVKVDAGEKNGGVKEIVCGAPNVPEPGHMVVLAPLDTFLPSIGLTIGKRDIGGVVSEGMLCSESELGLGESSQGILVLDPHVTEPGTPLATYLPQAYDSIFELNLTPNRADALGHVGLARELAAYYGLFWSPNSLPNSLHGSKRTPPAPLASSAAPNQTLASLGVKIEVEDETRAPYYGVAAATNIKIGPSPLWLKFRLQALGMRSISNLVDITNLVMLQWGHPMHGFDLKKVHDATIRVRLAKPGETLKTLDGQTRILDKDDLLITDPSGPIGIAGVMGGEGTEVSNDTKTVLFEVAYFDPTSIRRSARRHGLHTEASHRFERGIDPSDVFDVLRSAQDYTASLAGAEGLTEVLIVGKKSFAQKQIQLRASYMDLTLGIQIPLDFAISSLTRLGCVVKVLGENNTDRSQFVAECTIPHHRPDLQREVDLVEEVMRLYGVDHIKGSLPAICSTQDVGGVDSYVSRVKKVAVASGLSEALTYSLTSDEALKAVHAKEASVRLKNPLSEHQHVLRTSLLPGLLEALALAKRRGEKDAKLFTVGPVFFACSSPPFSPSSPSSPSEKLPPLPPSLASLPNLPKEELHLAVVLTGSQTNWLNKARALDVWDLKAFMERLTEELTGVVAEITQPLESELLHLHLRGKAQLKIDQKVIGSMGPLHPEVAEKWELDEVFVLELCLEELKKITPKMKSFSPLPKYPASARDLAIVVKESVPCGDILALLKEKAGVLAESVELFDRFHSEKLPPEHHSLAFRLVYRAPNRTLSDAEVDECHRAVTHAVEQRFAATQRV